MIRYTQQQQEQQNYRIYEWVGLRAREVELVAGCVLGHLVKTKIVIISISIRIKIKINNYLLTITLITHLQFSNIIPAILLIIKYSQ